MSKVILNRVKGCSTAPIGTFKEFQGTLKKIKRDSLEKLRQSMIRKGITAPLFVWQGNILDGHQRKIAAQSLIDDGYEVDDFPFVEIEAETEKEAREILLTYVSQYGEMTRQGLYDFLDTIDTPLSMITEFTNLNIPMEGMGLEGLDTEFSLPNNEKSNIEQITFTLDADQMGVVREALGMIDKKTASGNSNGYAIAKICKHYVEKC